MNTNEQNNADKPASEMTKRERMAMAAMQGLISAKLGSSWEASARASVIAADALLAELAKPKDGAK